MKINTKYHGEVEIEEKDIIQFESGIPGFLEEKRFTVIPLAEDESPLHILQSVESSKLAFVTTNPFLYFKEYDFELTDSVIEQLEIETEKDVIVLAILTVKDPFEESTANLQAPIIVNLRKQLGKQVVLNDRAYKTKHLLFTTTTSVDQGVK